MIIDFHTHTFPERIAQRAIATLTSTSHLKPYTDGTVKGLLHEMSQGGADYSVILPVVTNPAQFETIIRTAAQLNQQYEGKLLSFGGIHPESANYKQELQQIYELGLKGIKLHPDYQSTFIDDIRYLRIIDKASELGLITVVHAGVDIGYPDPVHCTPKAARSMIDQVHPKNLVLAHMGGCDLWDEVDWYLSGQDVYYDTAFIFHGMDQKCFLKLVKSHGADQVLFATDSPWCSQNSAIQWIQNCGLAEEDVEKILSNNAMKLLGITN